MVQGGVFFHQPVVGELPQTIGQIGKNFFEGFVKEGDHADVDLHVLAHYFSSGGSRPLSSRRMPWRL
jgi:hypothetical protein